MNKTEVLQAIAGLSLLSILFVPVGSEIWKPFLLAGLVFGGLWFWRLG